MVNYLKLKSKGYDMELKESFSSIIKNNKRRVSTALTIAALGTGASGCGLGSTEAHVPETAVYLGEEEDSMGDETHRFIFSEEDRGDISKVDCDNKEVEDPKSDGSIVVTCGTNFLYDMEVVVDK